MFSRVWIYISVLNKRSCSRHFIVIYLKHEV